MKTIIMNNNGMSCFVDDADYEWLNALNWYAWKNVKGNTWYAVRNIVLPDGKVTVQRMHKLITGNKQTDHHDGNGLNNQRENLRKATHSQNLSNRPKFRGKTSSFKGVSQSKLQPGVWKGQISVNRKHFTKLFKTEEEAARWYDEQAKLLHGEFANLNFKD